MYLSKGIAISDTMFHFISNHSINEIAQSTVVMNQIKYYENRRV